MGKSSPAKCAYIAKYGRHNYNSGIQRKLSRKTLWECAGCTETIFVRDKDAPEVLPYI
ncbi:hypothetical protein [Amycolatopsis sp. DSM 110486]|uniref:hypothetical protein n=1 Tax=Amycolatopsis sp. DSM 110486 TaxID=2865832 RepID=UPI001C698942|nr:hypothetical protein [Amycolatopsis sp. DSM 110486]QYN23160.1 hypothetical protein K1T34_12280 [Amycolatopsis sp. DSM 110486]